MSVAQSIYTQRIGVNTVEKTSCYLRIDTLSQILNFGNIYAGSRVMVWDGCGGVVLGSMVERMYEPRLKVNEISNQKQNQNLDPSATTSTTEEEKSNILDQTEKRGRTYYKNDPGIIFNLFAGKNDGLTESVLPRNFNYTKNKELSIIENIATHDIERMKMSTEEFCKAVNKDIHQPIERSKSESAKIDIKKKRKIKLLQMNEQRKDLQKGVDTMIFAGRANFEEFVPDLMETFLKASGILLIYCDCVEPLLKLFDNLRSRKTIINLELTSRWLREIQVLPGRTHPKNSMSTDGGYLLSCIKVDLLGTQELPRYPKKKSLDKKRSSNEIETNAKGEEREEHTIKQNAFGKRDIENTREKQDTEGLKKKQKIQHNLDAQKSSSTVKEESEENFFSVSFSSTPYTGGSANATRTAEPRKKNGF